MRKKIIATLSVIMVLGAILIPRVAPAAGDESTVKKFTIVSVEIDGAKFWLPSTINVNQGDTVILTLKNNIPGASNQHGFAIPAYHIQEVVTRGTDKTVKFVADKAGVFPYFCQLHAAHIGGQLEVEPKK